MTRTRVRVAACVAPKTGLTGYKIHGCGCDGCLAANRDYNNRYDRLHAYGRWRPLVDAGPAREHIQALRDARMGVARIAELAGVGYGTVNRLMWGTGGRPPTQRIRPHIEKAILRVRVDLDLLADDRAIDATGTQRRAQALAVRGWSLVAQAERIGWEARNYASMLRQGQVYARTARAVRDLYDELWDQQPAPDWTVDRTRRWAASKGWVGPGAWDDDTIDDPAAEPNVAGDGVPSIDVIGAQEALTNLTRRVPLAPVDRHYAVHYGLQVGMPKEVIATRLRMSGQHVNTLAARPLPDGYELTV